jgi:hypothetical protein
MNDAQWFKFYQPSLLGLVNTKHGRDLFDISHDLPTIVEIAPWYHKCLIGGNTYQSEFHSRAVFFRRLLHRWNEIVRELESPMFGPRYVIVDGRVYLVPMGGATLTAYPDADTESATVDGYIGFQGLDPGDRSNWSDTRTDDGTLVSSVGIVRDAHALINSTAHYNSGWEDFTRGFMLFDTSSIGSNVVSDAVYSFTSSQKNDTASEDTWNLVASTPASNTALVAADFDNVGSTSYGTIETTGVTANSSTYNDITLNSTGEGAVSTSGITKFAFRWEADRADSEEQSTSQILQLSADTSGTSKDPKLVVTHAAPAFTPEVRFF